jgi:hypothetical protein
MPCSLRSWRCGRCSAQGSIGFLGALPAGSTVVMVIAAGGYSQRLLARGVSSRVARGIFGGACVTLGGAALAIMPYLPGIPVKITLTIGLALPSVIYVISNAAVVSEITAVAQRGALRRKDRAAQGLLAIDEGRAHCERHAERWCAAELLRIKGELVLSQGTQGAAAAAADHFRQALDWARGQGALAWGPARRDEPCPVPAPPRPFR